VGIESRRILDMQKIYVRFASEDFVKEFSDRLRLDISDCDELLLPSQETTTKRKIKRSAPPCVQDWEEHWVGMPDFVQNKKEPYKLLTVHLQDSEEIRSSFARVTQQKITNKTKSIWYPKLDRGKHCRGRAWFSKESHPPQFPFYVISKSRATSCITSRALSRMGIPHKVVIEPVDYDDYAAAMGEANLLTLPFSDLDQGSIPARNWVWDYSTRRGEKWHWILDDNIQDFDRLVRNTKIKVKTSAIFKAAEDFVLRYKNIGQAGFNYHSFCKVTDKVPPYTLNTRIYSCILLRNDLDFRWRGRYNEDTDLSLRILKSGQCTILFNTFLADKVTTMRMKGGNTDHVYTDQDQRRKFAESLVEQHPDVTKVVWKFNRWHHHVDYRPFKFNYLERKRGVQIAATNNDYGLYIGKSKC